MNRFEEGDIATNGHWIGRVLAVSDNWVWVIPVQPVDPKNDLIDCGPLTFDHQTIDPV